ncbi:MAG: Ig-like domain-containing protein [Thermoplasmata archaeon]
MKRKRRFLPHALSIVLFFLLFTVVTLSLSIHSTLANEEGTPRKVLLELFTATWCPGCPYADAAADMLSVDYGPERLSVIEYHVSMLDSLSTDKTDARGQDYGWSETGLPASWVDGVEDANSAEQLTVEYLRSFYGDVIDRRLKTPSPIGISLSLTEHSRNLTVSVNFEKSLEIVISKPVFSRYVLFENSVVEEGEIYNYVARAIEERDFSYSDLPYSEDVVFYLDSSWNPSNMGVVVFVQIEQTEEVLQSASSVLGQRPIVNITTNIAGKGMSQTTRIEGTASEDSEKVVLRIDNKLYETAIGSTSWHYDIDPSKLSDGEHTLTIRAYSDSLVYSYPVQVSFTTTSSQTEYVIVAIVVLLAISVLLILLIARSRKKRRKE